MNKQNFNVVPMDKENASGAPILDNRIIVYVAPVMCYIVNIVSW